MRVLHICHGLFGPNNGVDIYIKTFIEVFPDLENIVIIPENKKELSKDPCKIIELNSLENLPDLVKDLAPDIMIIHWTGAECFLENKGLIRYKGRFYHTTGKKTIDYDPFSYINLTGFFYPRAFKIVTICHTEFKLPAHINHIFTDMIINVSYKAYYQNQDLAALSQVIYPTIREGLFRPLNKKRSKDTNKIIIGWLGRLNKYENSTYRIIKKAYGGDSKYKFIFAGKDHPDLMDKDRPENFIFPGNIPAETFFNCIDVFLYPSRLDSFSIALLEAMAAGKPALVSGVVKELAELGGAELFNNEDLIFKLNRLISDLPSRARRAQDQAGKIKKIFSRENFKNNFLSIFNYLLSDPFSL